MTATLRLFPVVETRTWIWVALAFVSASVLAEEARDAALPADYMDQIRQQIYDDAADWREGESEEDTGWRRTAEIPEKESRFGYDPEFDERLHRGEFGDYKSEHRFGEPEPSTFFKIELD